MSISRATLDLMYDYHYWATRRLLAACEALSPEQWDHALGHSWGSPHGMLAHMLAAEILWLARFEGESPKTVRQPSDYPSLAHIRPAWAETEARLRAFLDQCDDARLAREVRYTNTSGQPYAVPLGPLMLHLANHGTHHRGEAGAMLARLGVPHPEDDLLYFLFEQRQGPASTAQKDR